MRKILIPAIALAVAVPASAQQPTAEQNVDCAIWASYAIGSSEDEKAKGGLSIALAWFIGLYEGQTGQNIDNAMAARTMEMKEADINGLAAPCVARFQAFGARLSGLADRLRAMDSGTE